MLIYLDNNYSPYIDLIHFISNAAGSGVLLVPDKYPVSSDIIWSDVR